MLRVIYQPDYKSGHAKSEYIILQGCLAEVDTNGFERCTSQVPLGVQRPRRDVDPAVRAGGLGRRLFQVPHHRGGRRHREHVPHGPRRPRAFAGQTLRKACEDRDWMTSGGACGHDLYYSGDFGKSWINLTERSKHRVASFVDFDWAPSQADQKPGIMATVYEDLDHLASGGYGWDYNVHFVYSEDLFASPHEKLMKCGNAFEILSDTDVYVAKVADCEEYHVCGQGPLEVHRLAGRAAGLHGQRAELQPGVFPRVHGPERVYDFRLEQRRRRPRLHRRRPRRGGRIRARGADRQHLQLGCLRPAVLAQHAPRYLPRRRRGLHQRRGHPRRVLFQPGGPGRGRRPRRICADARHVQQRRRVASARAARRGRQRQAHLVPGHVRAAPARLILLGRRHVGDASRLGVLAQERARRDPGHRQRRPRAELRPDESKHVPEPRLGEHLVRDPAGPAHLRVREQGRAHRRREDGVARPGDQDSSFRATRASRGRTCRWRGR